MEDPQGGVGRLVGADDGEDSPVWLDACVRGPVPRLRQAQDAFEPVVVRNQIWFRLGSMAARFCSALVHDLASVWAHRRFLRA